MASWGGGGEMGWTVILGQAAPAQISVVKSPFNKTLVYALFTVPETANICHHPANSIIPVLHTSTFII